MATAILTINKPALDRALNEPSGEHVGRYLRERGTLALEAAKRQAGFKTGALRRSIRMSHLKNATGQYVSIYTNSPIAAYHHNGTRPHIIKPSAGHQVLKFSRGTQIVYTRVVKHPGNKPNPFLSDQLKFFRL